MEPIKPNEVQEKFKQFIPPEIIEAVNNLIVKNWNGTSATFKQDEVIAEYTKLGGTIERAKLYELHYLDFEDLFRNSGWKVMYDKPGYNEMYDAYFKFSS